MDLPPLPKTLQYGSWIGFTESIRIEFKALQETNQPLRKVIGNYCREYLNAFLNTYGGYLLFGVDDRGHVHGISLSASEADEIFLVIDNSLNQMRPQPGGVIQEVALTPVTNREEIISNKAEKKKYIVAVHISRGEASVYFTSTTFQSAYLRQAASNVKMLPETIIQRLNHENQTSFLVDSYDPFKLRYSPEDSSPNLINYCIRHQNVESITRQELLSTSINFLQADTQKCRVNVLILYGSETIGSGILDELSQSIVNDRKTFPAIYRVCSLDLRGSTDRPLSLEAVLIQLIHLLDNGINLSVIIPTYVFSKQDNTRKATVSPSDQNKAGMDGVGESAATMVSNEGRSTPYVQLSICQEKVPSEDVHLASSRDEGTLPETEQFISSPSFQVFLPETGFESLLSEISIATLRAIYLNALHRVNKKGENILLSLKDVGDKSILQSLLPIDVCITILITCRSSSQANIYESAPKYKFLYIPPSVT